MNFNKTEKKKSKDSEIQLEGAYQWRFLQQITSENFQNEQENTFVHIMH